MHELALTKNILKVAQRYAQASDATQVKAIFLRIGVLRDLEPAWVQRYFRYISKDTVAHEAEILIMIEPLVCQCSQCKDTFGVDIKEIAQTSIACPECSSGDYEIIQGMEFVVQSIEVT